MAGLPKKYAQMGFKKGWKAYKRIKKPTTRKVKSRGIKTMVKKSYKRKSTSVFGKLNSPITGAAGVVLYESLISPMIPLQGTAKDMLELVGGLYLSKKRGIIGATGKSLVTINAYQLVSGLVGNKLQGLLGKSSTSAYEYN